MTQNTSQQASEDINEYITFRIGDETHIVIDENIKDNASIFSQQYKDLKLITNYITDNQNIGNELNKNGEKENRKKIGSNICAIIGDRGTGKTSCMESFCQDLCQDNTYISLDLIDPSYFDDNRNILHNIIGMMFKDYKHDIQKKESNDIFCNDTTHHLTKAFQNVKDNLDELDNQNHKNNDSLEALMGFASGLSLNENLHELVKYYLQYKNNLQNDNTSKKSKLIIKIDDLDLNTEHGYQMMEQIRKYLNHDNIIIYVAMNIAQMSTVVQQELCKEYHNLLKGNLLNKEIIKERAEKYIVKLFPLSQRIYLPQFNTNLNRKICIQYNDNVYYPNSDINFDKFDQIITTYEHTQEKKNPEAVPIIINKEKTENNHCIKLYKDKETKTLSIYEFTILLIKITTNYQFHSIDGSKSLIIPNNLREYRLFLKFLLNFNDNLIFEKKEINILPKNMLLTNSKLFSNYLFNNYLTSHLTLDHIQKTQILLNDNELFHMNHNAIHILDKELRQTIMPENNQSDKYSNYFNYDSTKSGSELDNIIEKSNNFFNISLGDVLAFKNALYKTNSTLEMQYFLFAISWIYTHKLTESINQIEIQNDKFDFKNYQNTLRDYDKIVNGTFVNTDYFYTIKNTKKGYKNSNFPARFIKEDITHTLQQFITNPLWKEIDFQIYNEILCIKSQDKGYNKNGNSYRKWEYMPLSKGLKDTTNIICDYLSVLYTCSLPPHNIISKFDLKTNKKDINPYITQKYFSNIEEIEILIDYFVTKRDSSIGAFKKISNYLNIDNGNLNDLNSGKSIIIIKQTNDKEIIKNTITHLKELSISHKKLKNKINELDNTKISIENKIGEEKQKIKKSQIQLNNTINKIKSLESEIKNLKMNKNIQTPFKYLMNTNDKIINHSEILNNSINNLEKKILLKTSEMNDRTNKKEEIEEEIEIKNITIDDLFKKLVQIKNQLSYLKKSDSTYSIILNKSIDNEDYRRIYEDEKYEMMQNLFNINEKSNKLYSYKLTNTYLTLLHKINPYKISNYIIEKLLNNSQLSINDFLNELYAPIEEEN